LHTANKDKLAAWRWILQIRLDNQTRSCARSAGKVVDDYSRFGGEWTAEQYLIQLRR